MKRGIIALFLMPTLASACMWDSDTLSMEAKGLPTALDAIAGRMPINPPQFYQRRIELSKAALQRNQADYALYDNLAVAYDKLGRSEEAIAAIELKRTWLEMNKIAPTADPRTDPDYYEHYGMNKRFNSGYLVSGGLLPLTGLGKSWEETSTVSWGGKPLNNGLTQIEIWDPTALKMPWTVPWSPSFFR